MDKPATPPRRRMPKVLRVVRARPRLFIAAALAVVVSLLLPAQWPSGIPAGLQIQFQFWTTDAAALHGLSASNGLSALAH